MELDEWDLMSGSWRGNIGLESSGLLTSQERGRGQANGRVLDTGLQL